jgi:hypothetical protein
MLALWLALLLAEGAAPRSPAQHDFDIRCSGLESYDIRGSTDVDWSFGNVRSKTDSFVAGFTAGPMVAIAIPEERPPGFRWLREEKIGTVVLRYGLNVREKQLQATMFGANFSRRLNLVTRPGNEKRFIELTRALAVAQCRWNRLPDP